ncbi:DUF3050 domain-containing protein [Thalassoroseus pseudoceratinae]|uniref:DUF3050 domain-containing protein n=1 Tax=Thalassoroseus pseudoceratinae TaxID=2713176 RepID=UPI00142311BB|nr:DUF3050 domain-containing protein [Thalassoroseus pseudoceratinae]
MSVVKSFSVECIIEPALAPHRTRLLAHPIYDAVQDLPSVRTFMRSHVFAVWDFMSLLKRLQTEVTYTALPWQPPADPSLARFVNEIVLGEETDEDGHGGYCSHFELYRSAMDELHADGGPIDAFLSSVKSGTSAADALGTVDIPEATREFTLANLDVAGNALPHEVAAAFCFGREDIIPEMFNRLVRSLPSENQSVQRLAYYLERHIELDGDEHGPLAIRLVTQLCGQNEQAWQQATDAAIAAIELRIRLWDGVLAAIQDQ